MLLPLNILHAFLSAMSQYSCRNFKHQSYVETHLQAGLHWSKVFTARLSKEVKLVGSPISCESAHMGGALGREPRHNAHVQSYVMATDLVSNHLVLLPVF